MKKMMHKIIKAFSYVKTKFRLSRVRVDFSRGLKLEKNVSFFTDGSGEISFLGTAVVRALTEIRVADHASVTFGNGCFVNRNCMIISHDNITVGSGVMIGPNVMIYDHDHNYKAGGG